MPVTKSAKKALRKEHRNHAHNLVYIKKIKDLKKQILKLKEAKKEKEAQALLPKYYKVVDKAVKEKVLKKNTGARKKSRIIKFLLKQS